MDNKTPKTHVSPRKQQDPAQRESDTPATEGDSLAFLKRLAEASAVFVGFTFIGGWSYLASYYRTFGLNALELDVPLPVVCTTAVYMLLSAVWPLAAIALILLGWWLGWIVFDRHLRRLPRSVPAVVLAFLFLTVTTAGVFHGRRRANNDMLTDSNELPNVAFSTKLVKTDQPSCVDNQTYGTCDCKLLLHSKGTYYFFVPVPKPKDALTSAGNLNIYTLADSDVTGVHIQIGSDRNAGER
jgi:hypothetical protein